MLLVDADDAEPRYRREHRRPRPEHDRRFAACDARALVASLGLSQRRVQHGDALAEARAKASERLRRQRDLGHEDDRAAPALERGCARLQVDLGLAAASRAVQEEVGALARVEPVDDARKRRLLRVAQRRRRRLPGQRIALGRLCALAARLALHRRDELERAPGRRAVVVRHPERELDERSRQLRHDTLDRRRRHPVGRRHSDLGHNATPLRVAEAHLDDRAGLDLVGNLVRELTRERAGGDERVDGRVAAHNDQRRVAP